MMKSILNLLSLPNYPNIKPMAISISYPEDEGLPKYISANRKDRIIVSYSISKFPIGIEKAEYISKYFSGLNAYQNAVDYLDELKKNI